MEGNMSGKWKEKKNRKKLLKQNKTWEKTENKGTKITLKLAGVLYFGVGLFIISGKLAYFISGSILIQPEHYIWDGCGWVLRGSPRYVALQLAHLALTQHPSLQEKPFTQLQELCPELCEEDCRPALWNKGVLQCPQAKLRNPLAMEVFQPANHLSIAEGKTLLGQIWKVLEATWILQSKLNPWGWIHSS